MDFARKILVMCWEGKDVWFPEYHLVLFEGNDEGLLDWASLNEYDLAFDEARGKGDDAFYEIYNEGKTLYRYADSFDKTVVGINEEFEGVEYFDITTCRQAVEARDAWLSRQG